MPNSTSSLRIPFFNVDVQIRDVNTVLNLCYSAAWLAGVTCILHLTYKFIRNYTYVTVNCWFCNQDSRVPFKHRQEWICPRCEQFNGFTKDGDYSKVIPEQYDERLTARRTCVIPAQNKTSSLNGLCRTCNANQELKVRQIASYIPLREAEYDLEIESYRQKLERSYKLCSVCEQTVQSTLKLKSRMYGGEDVPKNEAGSKTRSLTKEDRTEKWKHLIGLLLATITLASLWHYFELHETCAPWSDTFGQLTMPNVDFFLNVAVLVSTAMFTKVYSGRAPLSTLILFGILSFATHDHIYSALKLAAVICTLVYLVYKYAIKRIAIVSFSEKISKQCYAADSENEDDDITNVTASFAFSLPNPDVPICGKLSDMNLGRRGTRSTSSTPKPSYLFKSSKLLVQPAKLILDDLDETTDTIRTFNTVSSGYDSVTSFLRKSPDSVSEFDSISQVGQSSRRASPNTNALMPYALRYRPPSYTPTSERFYGVSKTEQSQAEMRVSALFSTVQIFLCSLAFFILGFSFQLLISNSVS